MALRSSWKGFLKLSLVSVPVKAFTAAVSGGGTIHLNQLHAECNSRIQYRKKCPVHGEVGNDEIVSGYEYAKGQYVVVDPEELDKLRTENDRAIQIDAFISPQDLDAIYYTGKSYYLLPDGPVGQKPYAVLHRAMEEQNRYAVAQVVISGKEQIALLRPVDGLLVMTVLSYDAQIKKPTAFEDEVPSTQVSDEEVKLAKTLIDASTVEQLDYAHYRDMYTEKLSELIQAKIDGREIVTPPEQEEANVINLMDALKQSLARATSKAEAQPAAQVAKPPKKMAPSRRKQPAAKKKRKNA